LTSPTASKVYNGGMNVANRVVALCLALALSQVSVYVQQTDDAMWREFIEWAATVPPATFVGEGKKPAPANALNLYRVKLRREGISDQQIDAISQVLRKRMDGSAEWARLVYNNNFAPGVVKVYTEEPNPLVAEVARSRQPGTALDVAMGQGRNAIFLAQQGWQVTGFDVSDQGLAVAAETAKRLGLSLNLVRSANQDFDWGTNRWDMIVITYSPHVGPIERALKPGGVLVMETFLSEAVPKPPTSIGPNDALQMFPSLRVLKYEDTTAKSDWGGTQQRIVRLVAEKPQ
jgi:2-polyprenyl-3-methyl-5-hydroxy-6-metoxy-1,4-benzoquinol methylase